jgi:hypothetical protein
MALSANQRFASVWILAMLYLSGSLKAWWMLICTRIHYVVKVKASLQA